MRVLLPSVLAVLLVAACDRNNPDGYVPGPGSIAPPKVPAPAFDILDEPVTSSGWDITFAKTAYGEQPIQTATDSLSSLELFIKPAFIEGPTSLCIGGTINLSKKNLFGELTEATLEATFVVKDYVQQLKSTLKFEMVIAGKKRSVSIVDGTKIMTLSSGQMITIKEMRPQPLQFHDIRLVVQRDNATLYLDGPHRPRSQQL